MVAREAGSENGCDFRMGIEIILQDGKCSGDALCDSYTAI